MGSTLAFTLDLRGGAGQTRVLRRRKKGWRRRGILQKKHKGASKLTRSQRDRREMLKARAKLAQNKASRKGIPEDGDSFDQDSSDSENSDPFGRHHDDSQKQTDQDQRNEKENDLEEEEKEEEGKEEEEKRNAATPINSKTVLKRSKEMIRAKRVGIRPALSLTTRSVKRSRIKTDRITKL
eukprot:jgi/Bigna1/66834/fgenesh1_pg.2_\